MSKHPSVQQTATPSSLLSYAARTNLRVFTNYSSSSTYEDCVLRGVMKVSQSLCSGNIGLLLLLLLRRYYN